jgi:hypothetical protein
LKDLLITQEQHLTLHLSLELRGNYVAKLSKTLQFTSKNARSIVEVMTVQTPLHTTNTELWQSALMTAILSLPMPQKTNVWQIVLMDGPKVGTTVSKKITAIRLKIP